MEEEDEQANENEKVNRRRQRRTAYLKKRHAAVTLQASARATPTVRRQRPLFKCCLNPTPPLTLQPYDPYTLHSTF